MVVAPTHMARPEGEPSMFKQSIAAPERVLCVAAFATAFVGLAAPTAASAAQGPTEVCEQYYGGHFFSAIQNPSYGCNGVTQHGSNLKRAEQLCERAGGTFAGVENDGYNCGIPIKP